MSERTKWTTDFVASHCIDCQYDERIDLPLPHEQAALIRRARAHAEQGHAVTLERGQLAGVLAKVALDPP